MRSAAVGEIIEALNDLNTEEAPFPTVTEHTGDDEVFNEEAAFPFVSVGYAGGDRGEVEEYGATTYRATLDFEVAVAARDSTPRSRDGHAEAVALCDRIEVALQGLALSNVAGGTLQLVNEKLVEAWGGRFLYVQGWRATGLISR